MSVVVETGGAIAAEADLEKRAALGLPALETHLRPACKRVKVEEVAPGVMMAGPVRIPQKFIEALEQNQQIASCCRHPENHDFSAWYSSAADQALGVPDVYLFHCTCGRVHRRFMVGGSDPARRIGMRPFWEIR